MQTMSFDDWVRAWFDHPESIGTLDVDPLPFCIAESELEWVSPEDTLWYLPEPTMISYASQLFQHAGKLLADYSDIQVDHGFRRLITEGDTPLNVLCNTQVALDTRRACIEAIYYIYKDVFAHRENIVCLSYMWWDIFPISPACFAAADAPSLISAVFNVLEQTLALPSQACQSGALHGLTLWEGADTERALGIIEVFLATHAVPYPEWVTYVNNVRTWRAL